MSSLAPILEAFFTERLLTQRQVSPHTVASYRDASGSCSSSPSTAPARHPAGLSSPTSTPH